MTLPAIREAVVWLSGVIGALAVSNALPKYTQGLTALATVLSFIANKLPRADSKAVKELVRNAPVVEAKADAALSAATVATESIKP
jgi:hypothetical protein